MGSVINTAFGVKNCGAVRGNFYSVLKVDGIVKASRYNEWLDVGKLSSPLLYSFYMPNRTTKVDFYGGHAEAGAWKEDYHSTITLTPRVVKKDTKLKCENKTTDVGEKVTLEAKLEEKALPYYDIKNGLVKFYVGGAYVGYDYTDADGKAYVDYTPTAAGTFTTKVVFEGAATYNRSEGTCTLTVT
ncbi:unnamed protein product [marine sediment metagenome]|uniref:Bacterial Ig-like domain-containing protein n=1 Tax=marine sediment metagenome TaxID=412755 RepID=X1UQC1_9ZZZZ